MARSPRGPRPSPITEAVEWTADDERTADRAIARLNHEWAADEARGVDVDARMAQEVDALSDGEDDDEA